MLRTVIFRAKGLVDHHDAVQHQCRWCLGVAFMHSWELSSALFSCSRHDLIVMCMFLLTDIVPWGRYLITGASGTLLYPAYYTVFSCSAVVTWFYQDMCLAASAQSTVFDQQQLVEYWIRNQKIVIWKGWGHCDWLRVACEPQEQILRTNCVARLLVAA